MIAGDSVDRAVGEPRPQRVPVARLSERRLRYVQGAIVVVILLAREVQIKGPRLDIDRQPAGARG